MNIEQRTPYKAKVLLFAADMKCKPMIFVCGKKPTRNAPVFLAVMFYPMLDLLLYVPSVLGIFSFFIVQCIS